MSWLLDKSAFVRLELGEAVDVETWRARIDRGRVRISTITRLELGYSVRTRARGGKVSVSRRSR